MSHTRSNSESSSSRLTFSYQPLGHNDYARRIGLAIATLSDDENPELARTTALNILLASTQEDWTGFPGDLN